LLDADGDTLANQLEFVFMDEGYDPFTYDDPAAFPWAGDPDGDGISTQVEFVVYHTNPKQGDTDGDGLPDAWEIAHNLDPGKSTNPDGGSGDPDSDGLSNFDEWLNGSTT
jgi:hypothetical protein